MSSVPPGPPPGRPPINMTRPPGPPPGGPPGQPFRPVPNFGYPGIPPVMPNFPPPLPAGWSEHRAPDGITTYYYNSQSRESTYIRPSAFPPFPPTNVPPPPISGQSAPSEKEKKKKKEKPKDKVPIPGTTWTRVKTNEGNVFYFEKESKRSEWSVPEEIKEEVGALEKEEREAKELAEKEAKEKAELERLERIKEQERIRLELQEERKAKIAEAERKRKEREEAGDDGDGVRESKVAKLEDNDDTAAEAGESQEVDENGEVVGPADDEDEAEWMKAVAAEFAEADRVAAEEREQQEEDTKQKEEEAAKKVFAVPDKVNVTPEEGRALFKALLIEKDISPFAPWDQSLPLFINDPRYILLSNTKDRRDVYEEYCRDVGRARRLQKASASTGAPGSSGASKKADPERDYKAFLREEVTSTRTRWDDFRKKWKKDRRFYAFGRDDREREKVFKVHLRELGERKRANAQRAEQDFLDLLKESEHITSTSVWSEAKKTISHDARYDAVGSSSLREELFNTYLRKLSSSSAKEESKEEAALRKAAERKAREEASLRERQAKVVQDKQRVELETNKSRAGAGREEGERLFGSLLVDQVRDAETTFAEAAQYLQTDPRFNHPSLGPRDKQRLFSAHVERLGTKRSNALHSLFDAHTPSLDTGYETVYPQIVDDPLVRRLGLEGDALEDRWKAYLRSREAAARSEFDQMLGENSFVDFWGKMRKKSAADGEGGMEFDANADVDEEEGGGFGAGGEGDDDDGEGAGKKGLTALAKQIDLSEIKAVLRRDKRYRQFDHVPDIREQWLRDYLENLEAASGSQTIHSASVGFTNTAR